MGEAAGCWLVGGSTGVAAPVPRPALSPPCRAGLERGANNAFGVNVGFVPDEMRAFGPFFPAKTVCFPVPLHPVSQLSFLYYSILNLQLFQSCES